MLIHENIFFATNFVKLSTLNQKLWQFINFGCGHLGGHLVFSYVDTQEVILLYLDELLIYENIYFATNFVKLSAIKQKLWQCIDFGCGHLGGHLGFSHLHTSEDIL